MSIERLPQDRGTEHYLVGGRIMEGGTCLSTVLTILNI